MGLPTKIETNYDFCQNQVKNFVHDNRSSAPSIPVTGQEYYNSSTNKKYYWNGAKWIEGTSIATDEQAVSGIEEDVAINPKQLKSGLDTKQNALNYTAENITNKVTNISSSSSDTQYPSAKLLYDLLLTYAKLANPAFTGIPTVPTAAIGDSSFQIANTDFVTTAINSAVSGGIRYAGTWDTTGAIDYSSLNSYRPVSRGCLFRCIGTGCTIDSVEYNDGDVIIFNRDVSSSTSITTAMIDKYDHTQSTDTVLLDAVQTLTNKTINAGNNNITNLALSMFASGIILTSMSNSPSDDALLTEKAINTLLTSKADILSPSFLGTPSSPTASEGDCSLRIANTAFVSNAVSKAISGNLKLETYFNTSLIPVDGICTWNISHTLGSRNVICEIYEVSTGDKVIMSMNSASSTTFTIQFNASSTVAANTYKAILIGG